MVYQNEICENKLRLHSLSICKSIKNSFYYKKVLRLYKFRAHSLKGQGTRPLRPHPLVAPLCNKRVYFSMVSFISSSGVLRTLSNMEHFLKIVNGFPADNCMFKVNNRNTRTRCEICSKLTIKTPERR